MTRVVRCAADAEGLDFLVADDMLNTWACDVLAKTYRDSATLYENWHKDAFWRDRLLGWRDIPRGNPADFMGWALNATRPAVREYYGTSNLDLDVLHLVGWPTGYQMTPHADNAHESGEIHEFHWRDYSGVLYLNDDFEGGGLYLPKQDILIEPHKGMFVSLPCGLSHMHGVQEITSGLRITLAFFLTTDISHADRDLLEKTL